MINELLFLQGAAPTSQAALGEVISIRGRSKEKENLKLRRQ